MARYRYQATLYQRATRVTFTITLNENGAIGFNYTGIDTNGHDQGNAATIGVENNTGSAATQYAYRQTLLATDKAITFTPVTAPTTSLPDVEYIYTLRPTGGPNAVTTKVLGPNGNQITSYQLYDGRLRLRQTQAPAAQANGGRIITDTAYDGRGQVAQTSTFWNSATPTDAVAGFNNVDVLNQHRHTYDNLGRQTIDALWSANTLKWQTTIAYNGDRVAVTQPAGGVATVTINDARGLTTELRQYLAGTPSGSYQATTYTYDRLGRSTGATDPAGNTWTSHYDLRGRIDSATDPDAGTTTTAFDNGGRPTTVTDARSISLSYAYDDLGRRTGRFDDTDTSGFQRAKWIYDSVAKGQLTSSTRYVGTDAFTTTVTGYDDGYRPLGSTTVIPSSMTQPGLPAASYTTSSTYNVNGSVATLTYPNAGDLAAETVTTTYDNTGRALTLASPNATYVAGTSYYNLGAPYQQLLGGGGKRIRQTAATDQATGRLLTATTDTENQSNPNTWVERLTENYGYDPAGNVKNITETNAGTTVSNQCFSYDALRQLTQAWTTASSTCQSSPSAGVVAGPDAYWTSYTYDNTTGNRTTEMRHALTGTDTTRTYTYPTTGKRHTLTNVTATGGTTGTDTYTYDNTGNTQTRNIAGKPGQTLTWDNEGHLASIADTGGTTSYIYDADGNRLVAKDPAGATVYLPGFELRKVGSTTTCIRYVGRATRTATGITWIADDAHGTGQLAIDAGSLTVTRRKTDPFGNLRGADPTWPNPHGFVGGVRDNTGLTHLGAREYDPSIGRFISADPVLDLRDPQQTNGYTYAVNNPVTSSDPSGLCPADRCDGYGPNPGQSTGIKEKAAPKVKHKTTSDAGPTRQPTTDGDPDIRNGDIDGDGEDDVADGSDAWRFRQLLANPEHDGHQLEDGEQYVDGGGGLAAEALSICVTGQVQGCTLFFMAQLLMVCGCEIKTWYGQYEENGLPIGRRPGAGKVPGIGRTRPVTPADEADQVWKDLATRAGQNSAMKFGENRVLKVYGKMEYGDAEEGVAAMTKDRLLQLGLDRDKILIWRDYYSEEFLANQTNSVAGLRAGLMNHYLELLG